MWSRWGQVHQGKWWTMNETETKEAVMGLANASFPLDTFIFDMNWHIKPGWTGWTWDTNWYPDHVGLLSWLHEHGLYTAANIHDAEGVMAVEKRYSEMAQAMGIDPASNQTVAFHISNQTYYNALSNLVMKPLADEGLDFWWTDWQQGLGGTLDVTGLNPTIWLNHLRFMNYSQPGSTRRGQILSRYGGLGNSRYAVGFGGDVSQTWESLMFMVYTTMTSTNVAFPYWAQEIMDNGSLNPLTRPPQLELFIRVTQFGAFAAAYTNYGNPGSDPAYWLFPTPFQMAAQRVLAIRSMLLPYRYNLARFTYETGLGSLRPMYYHCPMCPDAYNETSKHQYMFGDSLLVSPVYSELTCGKNCSEGTANATIWFPATDSLDNSSTPITWVEVNVTLAIYFDDILLLCVVFVFSLSLWETDPLLQKHTLGDKRLHFLLLLMRLPYL
eukprot:m.160266 g.160266  ORF g.160266 m.160266 type:complete len:440 (+) comp15167_c0_seq4:1371-2690(+)